MTINNSINARFTQYNVISGGATNTINNISPSIAGYGLISNGLSAQPSFQPIPASSSITYYLTNTASGVAGYLKQLTSVFSPKTDLPFASIASGNTLLQNWITDPGIPNLSSIPAGTFVVHIHADQTAGSRNVQLYAEIWESSSVGVDIAKIGTTELTPVLIGIETEYNIAFVTDVPYIMGSTASRITTRVFASGAVTGSDATVHIFVGGTADSHLSLPSNTIDVSNFVPYTGAVNDVNLGTHTISASSASLTNALTVANGGTGRQTLTNHGVLIGAATTAITQLTVGTNGQVLLGSTNADPAFATLTSSASSLAYTTGAAALNIDVANFATTTWTPTLTGSATAGSTSYTAQNGYYTRFLNLVYIEGIIVITAATGTGNAVVGNLPFTVKNQTNYNPIGIMSIASAAWAWTGSGTQLNLRPISNTTTCTIDSIKSTGAANLAMTNGAATFTFSCWYQV